MSESSKSSSRSKVSKPKKPYADFPLFPHATRRWAKKIRGKLNYFGKWDDPQAALDRFNRDWPFLSEGRTPPPIDDGEGCTLRMLCNSFLASKQNKLEANELTERTFQDYYAACKLLIDRFGADRQVDDLRPDDFERLRANLAANVSAVTLRNQVNRCRVVLKFAFDQGLIDTPIRYGQSFDRPSAKTLRKARNESGPRMFEANEVRRVLNVLEGIPVPVEGEEEPFNITADHPLRAMVLLGMNCGFGNTDVASLPESAVDLKSGWIEFPRPKTEIHRRIPLWPETVDALRNAIDDRPIAKSTDDDELCFLTRTGQKWVRVQQHRDSGAFVSLDPLSQRFSRLLKAMKLNGRRGLGFYTLRHVFETIGGESKDQVAVNAIMGHVDATMGGVYRERISDARLRAVTDTVREWLYECKE